MDRQAEQEQPEPDQRGGRTQAEPLDQDELNEEILDLVTGGMGPVIAIENYAALVNALSSGG